MALKHDEQGFLVGELIEVDKTSFGKAMAIWGDMRRDVSAIRNTLTGKIERAIKEQVAATPRLGREVARVLSESKPSRQRDAKGRFVATAKAATPSRSREASAVQPTAIKALTQSAEKKAATPSETRKTAIALAREVARETNGKFAKKNETPEEKAAREAEEKAAEAKAARSERWGRAKDGMKDAAAGAVDTAEALDPAVAATKEMANVAAPLVKVGGLVMKGGLAGIKGIGKGAWGATKWVGRRFGIGSDKEGKEQVSWLRRMWRELRDLNKKEGGGGRGLLGMLGAALAGLPGLLSKAVSGLLPKFLKNGLGAIPGMLGGAGRLLGKALPIAAAGASLFSSWESFNTSTDDYRKRFGAENQDSGFWEDLGVRTVGVLSDQIKTFTGHMFDGVIDDWSKQTIKFFGGLEDRLSKTWDSMVDWVGNKATAIKDAASAAVNTTKLALGGRGKVDFSGFTGAEGLSKNGAYTKDEANKIIALKKAGENTGVGSGLSEDLRKKIITQANLAGLDPQMMLAKAMMESGGNANAVSPTGAIGLYQFTGGTASDMGISDRFNVDQNIAAAMRLTNMHKGKLERLGLPATPENLYLMHQLGGGDKKGMGGAPEMIKAAQNGTPISKLSAGLQGNAALNVGGKSGTAAQYVAANTSALAAARSKVTAVTGGTSAPGGINVPAHPPVPAQQPVAATTQLNKPAPIVVQVQGAGGAGRGPSDPAIANIANGGTYRTGHNG
jgi:hypothetical protein